MATTTIETRCWGQTYAVRADWAQASCPVQRDTEDGWISTGRQVADYCHDGREALRAELLASAAASGEVDEDTEARIDRAVARATEEAEQVDEIADDVRAEEA